MCYLVLESDLFHLDARLRRELIDLKETGVDFEVIRKAEKIRSKTTIVLLTKSIKDKVFLKLILENNKILKVV